MGSQKIHLTLVRIRRRRSAKDLASPSLSLSASDFLHFLSPVSSTIEATLSISVGWPYFGGLKHIRRHLTLLKSQFRLFVRMYFLEDRAPLLNLIYLLRIYSSMLYLSLLAGLLRCTSGRGFGWNSGLAVCLCRNALPLHVSVKHASD